MDAKPPSGLGNVSSCFAIGATNLLRIEVDAVWVERSNFFNGRGGLVMIGCQKRLFATA